MDPPKKNSDTFHRIGGASIGNLRLKPRETTLNPPGISVIKARTPEDAVLEIRTGLPKAKMLSEQSKTVGSATVEAIQKAGFNVIPSASTILPNHHRITHPDGVTGFDDANLARLSDAFVNTTGY